MIKTVKVKKKLRLDELIRYAFDNDVKDTRFESSNGSVIYFDEQGGFTLGEIFSVKKKSTFTVEVEGEITEDTEFEAFVVITDKGIIKSINNYHNMRSVRGLLENYEVEQKIYALIDNDLQLIWEAE